MGDGGQGNSTEILLLSLLVLQLCILGTVISSLLNIGVPMSFQIRAFVY